MQKKIMIVGLGVLGGHLLDMLLRMSKQHKIIVASRNDIRLRERTNLSELVAVQLGHNPDVSFIQLDLMNIDETAEIISRVNPDIIFNAASLMSYWVPTQLPRKIWNQLYYAYTGWQLPMHLTLIYKLMRAVQQSGCTARVVNGSYPDVTNPILHKIGLAPEVGIGNIANVVPVIRKSVSHILQQPLEKVQIHLIGHHHFSYRIPTTGNSAELPFNINVILDGSDVTSDLDMGAVFELLPTEFRRTRGQEGMLMTAASAVTVLEAMANETNAVVHAPGPNGLPGGYPVTLNKSGSKVILPMGLEIDEAIRINIEGQILDGVQKIDDDGTVHFTDREMSVVKRIFGYECLRMSIYDCEEWAKELDLKYKKFVQNIGELEYA